MKIHWVTSAELGKCPAAVDMDTGIIEINQDVWDKYTQAEQAFIVAHEEGHYVIPTDDETEADIYALRKVAGQFPRSLAQSLNTLFKVGVVSESRMENAYIEALRLDAEMGSEFAKNELAKIDNDENYYEKTETMQDFNPNRKWPRRGFIIRGCYISFEVAALAVIAILLYKLLKK